MTQLVQSSCPGCKQLLRIPADWLHQAIRCKHCGMVMQARQPAMPAAPVARPVSPTPLPATRKASVTPAAPLAVPVVPAATGSPFADFASGEETAPRASRRRKSGGWWKGPAIALAVFILAGVVAVANWQRIVALFPPLSEDEPVAVNDKTRDPVAEPPVKKQEEKKQTTPVKTVPDKERPKNNDAPPKTNPPKTNPPKTIPPKTNPPRTDPPKVDPPRPTNSPFPRRALVISVHDYLYANPVQDGPHGRPADHNFKTLLEALQRGLNVPMNQLVHLSDGADKNWGAPRAPTRPVIEKTLKSFLDSSRAQDRVLVFFVGHSVELGDDVYLAPIEGELDKADTLIPLKWFYEQMSKCKARQKVLVFDVNRFNQTFGQERPGGEEMGAKLDALLKAPPAGVQVWASCSLKQRSYAADDFPMGVFFDQLQTVLERKSTELPNLIQAPDKPLPLDRLVSRVNEKMKKELDARKLEQVSRLSGTEADAGLAYDKSEPPAPEAVACLAGASDDIAINKMLIESVLDQVGTPPVKVTHEMALRYDALPPFPVESLQKYQGDKPNPDSPLRKAVKNARAVLWAIYPGGEEPKELSGEVGRLRGRIRVQMNVLREGYRAPAGGGGNAENQFKSRVESDERAVALIMSHIDDALEQLEAKEVVEARDGESKRWKANFDFIKARILLEYAYLFEYQSMLGSMRKEFPPRDPALHGGWKLASQPTLQGDSKGKKFAREAQKLLDKIIKDNSGSPYEVLAKREKLTHLGLEWVPAR